jgi:hypothetical protein
MTLAVFYLIGSVLALWLLWVFYLAVMNLKRVKDAGKLNKTCLYLGLPVLFVGLALDFLCNVFIMTLVLLELPEETTVTARLQRHKIHSTGWRLKVVNWFETVLDEFDPSGNHV